MVTFCNVSGVWGVRVAGVALAYAQPNARMTAIKKSGETKDVVLVSKQQTGTARGEPFEVWTIRGARRVSAYRGSFLTPRDASQVAADYLAEPTAAPPAPEPPQPTTAPELFALLLAKPVAEDVAFRITRDQNGDDEARVGVSW